MTTVPRTLVNVQQELSVALQNRTSGMLAVVRLLNEAKALVDHGAWLPWLRRHTALPPRTAQQYMAAAAWADAKNATIQGNESRLTRLCLQWAESVQQVLRVPGGALAAALD